MLCLNFIATKAQLSPLDKDVNASSNGLKCARNIVFAYKEQEKTEKKSNRHDFKTQPIARKLDIDKETAVILIVTAHDIGVTMVV